MRSCNINVINSVKCTYINIEDVLVHESVRVNLLHKKPLNVCSQMMHFQHPATAMKEAVCTRWSILLNKASTGGCSPMTKRRHGQLPRAHGGRMLPLKLTELLMIGFVNGWCIGGYRYVDGQVWIGAVKTGSSWVLTFVKGRMERWRVMRLRIDGGTMNHLGRFGDFRQLPSGRGTHRRRMINEWRRPRWKHPRSWGHTFHNGRPNSRKIIISGKQKVCNGCRTCWSCRHFFGAVASAPDLVNNPWIHVPAHIQHSCNDHGNSCEALGDVAGCDYYAQRPPLFLPLFPPLQFHHAPRLDKLDEDGVTFVSRQPRH